MDVLLYQPAHYASSMLPDDMWTLGVCPASRLDSIWVVNDN